MIKILVLIISTTFINMNPMLVKGKIPVQCSEEEGFRLCFDSKGEWCE